MIVLQWHKKRCYAEINTGDTKINNMPVIILLVSRSVYFGVNRQSRMPKENCCLVNTRLEYLGKQILGKEKNKEELEAIS